MNITVTHTIDQNVLNIIQAFFSGINGAPVAKKTSGKTLTASKEQVAEPANEIAAVEGPTTDKPAINATVETVITLEQVRALATAKMQNNKREEVKKVLSEFGADKVTNLQKEQYAAFYSKIEAL